MDDAVTATLPPPGTVTLGYEPQKMQKAFHTAPADEVLYGGAMGGGKSAALANHAVIECATTPKTTAVIFRRTSPELQEIKDYLDDLLEGTGLAQWFERRDRYEFTNGSIIRLSHLQLFADVRKHKGNQYTLLMFDEISDFMPEQVEWLKSRNRSPVKGAWCRVLASTNPGGIGHVYIKDYFVRPLDEFGHEITNVKLAAYYDFDTEEWVRTEPGKGLWKGEFNHDTKRWEPCPPWDRGKPSSYVVWLPELTREEIRQNKKRIERGRRPIVPTPRVYIKALLEHNEYLDDDPAYEAKLSRMSEKERKAYRDGDWDIFEGQYFSEFHHDLHVVEEQRPPAHWRKWRSLDWGRAEPACVLWHAQDPETDHIVTYREIYGRGYTNRRLCELINSMTADDEWIDFTMCDPSMARSDGNDENLSHMDTFEQYGVKLTKADNNRVAGWNRVKDLMAIDLKTVRPDSDDPKEKAGRPYWTVTRNCTNLIRTLPQQLRDEDDPEDMRSDGEDHAADALRYGLMSAKSMKARRNYKIGPVTIRR
jgi:hypothetical protein